MSDEATAEEARGYEAVGTLYHAFLTGLILTVVTRRGSEEAAELVYRLFRRQQSEKFLPGLKKLGLAELPHAVAAAQYHYLSNQIGGVKVQYMYESDRKAWVRYVPPRWIFDGTAICAIPSEVSRAMLRGWHARNGISLGNPRLGVVCTKMTTDGDPGLEVYFFEHDRDLKPEERLRFAPDEDGPDFDPSAAPRLPSAEWPLVRQQKALRNYTREYVRSMLPEMIGLMGAGEAGRLASLTGRLIGMQFFDRTARLLGIDDRGAPGFARYLAAMQRAQGEQIELESDGAQAIVRQRTWKLARGLGDLPPEFFDGWNALWEGALSIHNRRLELVVRKRIDLGDSMFEWIVRPKTR